MINRSMGKIDFDVASLAAGVAAGLKNNVEAGATSYKDMEVLNPNRIDLRRFLGRAPNQYSHTPYNHPYPQNPYANPYQQQQMPPHMRGPQYPPQQRPNPHQQYPPQQRPQQNPYANNIPVAPVRDERFDPVALPNKPTGYLPMSEESKKYLAPDEYGFSPQTDSSFEKPDISAPLSFQNTKFNYSDGEKDLDNPQNESILDDLRRKVSNQTAEIDSLKKMVRTLNTRILKLIKTLDQKEEIEHE